MRKDIFIVGARLAGIWQLLGAANTLATLTYIWLWPLRPASSNQEMYILHFAVQLVTGIHLLLRTHQLFNLLQLSKEEEPAVDPTETGNEK
jgi:hypothetical protein